MIASITFTYGEERTEVYEFKSKDRLDKIFRNSFDYNLYVFHNSPDSFIKKIKDSKLLSDFKFTFAGINGPWPSAFRQALLHLKEKGVTKMVFMEDDVFTICKDEQVILDLADFLKTTDTNYLNLEYNSTTFSETIKTRKHIINRNHFNVIDTDTEFFRTAASWSWSFDHSPYYCNLDFALNNFYTEQILTCTDIWAVEWLLKHKYDTINMPRHITDRELFRRVNLSGRHPNREPELKFLKDNFNN